MRRIWRKWFWSWRKQFLKRGFKAGGGFYLRGNLRAVVRPEVAGTVRVFQKLFRRTPVVAHGDAGRAFIEVKIKPVLRIRHEPTWLDVGNKIFSDDGAGLCGQSVNAAEIAQPPADLMDVVRENKIVTERVRRFRPAPADADAGVGQVENFVVFDGDVARVADADADAAPVLVAAIGDDVVGDFFLRADLAVVSWVVGDVRFDIGVRKFTELDPVAADVAEDATGHPIVVRAALKIQTGGSGVFKRATLKRNVTGAFHRDGGGRAADPREVVETGMITGAFG